jgi:hypothetical protein
LPPTIVRVAATNAATPRIVRFITNSSDKKKKRRLEWRNPDIVACTARRTPAVAWLGSRPSVRVLTTASAVGIRPGIAGQLRQIQIKSRGIHIGGIDLLGYQNLTRQISVKHSSTATSLPGSCLEGSPDMQGP